MSDTYIPRGEGKRNVAFSKVFDIDNGAGTNDDDAFLVVTQPISIKSAKVLYTNATTATVAGASVTLGTTAGGNELVAATNLENSKAIGTTTALTLKSAASFVAANTMIHARHTGVAVTQAGMYRVVIEFYVLA